MASSHGVVVDDENVVYAVGGGGAAAAAVANDVDMHRERCSPVDVVVVVVDAVDAGLG